MCASLSAVTASSAMLAVPIGPPATPVDRAVATSPSTYDLLEASVVAVGVARPDLITSHC